MPAIEEHGDVVEPVKEDDLAFQQDEKHGVQQLWYFTVDEETTSKRLGHRMQTPEERGTAWRISACKVRHQTYLIQKPEGPFMYQLGDGSQTVKRTPCSM